jgi:hypothetical protein
MRYLGFSKLGNNVNRLRQNSSVSANCLTSKMCEIPVVSGISGKVGLARANSFDGSTTQPTETAIAGGVGSQRGVRLLLFEVVKVGIGHTGGCVVLPRLCFTGVIKDLKGRVPELRVSVTPEATERQFHATSEKRPSRLMALFISMLSA